MGVPASATRADASNSLTARVWRVPGFLIAWASSRIAKAQRRLRNHCQPSEHSVGRNDKVLVAIVESRRRVIGIAEFRL